MTETIENTSSTKVIPTDILLPNKSTGSSESIISEFINEQLPQANSFIFNNLVGEIQINGKLPNEEVFYNQYKNMVYNKAEAMIKDVMIAILKIEQKWDSSYKSLTSKELHEKLTSSDQDRFKVLFVKTEKWRDQTSKLFETSNIVALQQQLNIKIKSELAKNTGNIYFKAGSTEVVNSSRKVSHKLYKDIFIPTSSSYVLLKNNNKKDTKVLMIYDNKVIKDLINQALIDTFKPGSNNIGFQEELLDVIEKSSPEEYEEFSKKVNTILTAYDVVSNAISNIDSNYGKKIAQDGFYEILNSIIPEIVKFGINHLHKNKSDLSNQLANYLLKNNTLFTAKDTLKVKSNAIKKITKRINSYSKILNLLRSSSIDSGIDTNSNFSESSVSRSTTMDNMLSTRYYDLKALQKTINKSLISPPDVGKSNIQIVGTKTSESKKQVIILEKPVINLPPKLQSRFKQEPKNTSMMFKSSRIINSIDISKKCPSVTYQIAVPKQNISYAPTCSTFKPGRIQQSKNIGSDINLLDLAKTTLGTQKQQEYIKSKNISVTTGLFVRNNISTKDEYVLSDIKPFADEIMNKIVTQEKISNKDKLEELQNVLRKALNQYVNNKEKDNILKIMDMIYVPKMAGRKEHFQQFIVNVLINKQNKVLNEDMLIDKMELFHLNLASDHVGEQQVKQFNVSTSKKLSVKEMQYVLDNFTNKILADNIIQIIRNYVNYNIFVRELENIMADNKINQKEKNILSVRELKYLNLDDSYQANLLKNTMNIINKYAAKALQETVKHSLIKGEVLEKSHTQTVSIQTLQTKKWVKSLTR